MRIYKWKFPTIFMKIYNLQLIKIVIITVIVCLAIITGYSKQTNIQFVSQFTKNINTGTYKKVIGNEIKTITIIENNKQNRLVMGNGISSVLFKFFTGIDLYNMHAVLFQQVPAFGIMTTELISKSEHLTNYVPPEEMAPPSHLFDDNKLNDRTQQDEEKTDKQPTDKQPTDKQPTDKQQINKLKPDNPPILIYHTHNREAYLPELNGNLRDNEAYHPQNNITVVGNYLAVELEKLGVPTIVSTKDYWNELPAGEYWRSYEISKKELEKIYASNEYIPFIFDIHRDSSVRSRTTVNYKGDDYAALWFIIGQLNDNWQYNYQFAANIESKIEEKYPGISRGIWAKKSGHYNQAVSPNSVLVEIGGVDNTLTEAKRTVTLLAEIIAELYWNQINK